MDFSRFINVFHTVDTSRSSRHADTRGQKVTDDDMK